MKKVLVLASVASMIDQFNIPSIKLLQEIGYRVDVACNFKEGNTCSEEKIKELKIKLRKMNVDCYQIDFARNITNIGSNIKALWQVEALMNRNKYIFIHCHSPIGGVIGRISGKKENTKVIYTAHGFHFYKGAPLQNWIIFYPIEKILSRYTDTLLTINKEDYCFARKNMNAKYIDYIPGIGINLDKFKIKDFDRKQYRKHLGINDDDFVILSVGELNDNKNHEQVLKAISLLKKKNIHYIIAGQGNLKDYLIDLSKKLGIENQLHLLGFRKDIAELDYSSDLFILSSLREGLNVSLMEAMAVGLPCIANSIRGNVDLIDDELGGYLVKINDVNDMAAKINQVINTDSKEYNTYNREKIEHFSEKEVLSKLNDIYSSYLWRNEVNYAGNYYNSI